jgi:hypothetical protein
MTIMGIKLNARLGRPNKFSIAGLESTKDTAIKEYATWNENWHQSKQDYRDLPRLKTMLGNLTSLDEVSII